MSDGRGDWATGNGHKHTSCPRVLVSLFCPLIGCVLTQAPPQPLLFAPGVANVRKLQELPYHLLHAGLWEELRQEVIGKMRPRIKQDFLKDG